MISRTPIPFQAAAYATYVHLTKDIRSCFLFWTYGATGLSTLTASITDGPWSHMGIGFTLQSGEEIMFESLVGRGFLGPNPMSSVDRFVAEDPRRKLFVAKTSLTQTECRIIYTRCLQAVGVRGYAEWQLVQLFFSERYRIPVRPSPNRWICSEAASRLVYPFLDLRDTRRHQHDMVNPNSAFRRWCEMQAGYQGGRPIQPPKESLKNNSGPTVV